MAWTLGLGSEPQLVASADTSNIALASTARAEILEARITQSS
jgi:hypothetical protein